LDADEKAIRKAISAAYPFGERDYWPYKVWLDEVRRQLEARRRPAQAPIEALPLFVALAPERRPEAPCRACEEPR
jgi:hypothetical protein